MKEIIQSNIHYLNIEYVKQENVLLARGEICQDLHKKVIFICSELGE